MFSVIKELNERMKKYLLKKGLSLFILISQNIMRS